MLDLVLLLAMTCVAEIDLQGSPDECVIMWSINERSAERRGVSLERHTRQFNAYWRNARARRGRPWIEQLDATDRQPADWPSRRSWERERPKWHRYVEAAERFATEHFKGQQHTACARADDYGGDPDDGKHADDAAPCAQARRVRGCVAEARQAYWDTRPCRYARRRKGRSIPATLAAGRP
ncbi:MAG: hypothetical protein QGG14_07680 [Planctomycetota bacterium]|nr:hypothetical protein [Planctomycetota bacterium]